MNIPPNPEGRRNALLGILMTLIIFGAAFAEVWLPEAIRGF